MFLGAHLGIADGLTTAVDEAQRLSLESLQIFSKSPQMWAGPPIPAEAAAGFRAAVHRVGLRATAVHHGYLLNLASPKPPMLARSLEAFRDEIARADLLAVDALIFHPGAHLASGTEAGLRTIVTSLTTVLAEMPKASPRLLLENAAGQGTTLCARLEELGTILDGVGRTDRVGVALDTCHLFAAGYDFRTDDDYGALVDAIAGTIGVDRVRAFHLNDAKAELGAHLDRHENIGDGNIGLAGFHRIVNDRRWAGVPGFLETPLDERGYTRYAEEVAKLRSLVGAPAPSSRRSPARSPSAPRGAGPRRGRPAAAAAPARRASRSRTVK